MGKILETERLILRTWTYADAERLFEICSDAETMLHIGDGKPYESIERAKEFLNWAIPYQLKMGFSRWAVVEKQSGEIIGSCGFARLETAEIEFGYLFARQVWGNGFATEAAQACLKYGFEEIGFEKIVALTDLDHEKSQNVLRKVGFYERGIEKTEDGDDLVFEIKL
ncbi:MAG: GNAT family N-acetyltransferase [Pyrinomonadaceae bacterium]